MLEINHDRDDNVVFVAEGILKSIIDNNDGKLQIVLTIKIKDKLKNIHMLVAEKAKQDFILICKVNDKMQLWGNILEKDNSYILEVIGGQLYEYKSK